MLTAICFHLQGVQEALDSAEESLAAWASAGDCGVDLTGGSSSTDGDSSAYAATGFSLVRLMHFNCASSRFHAFLL